MEKCLRDVVPENDEIINFGVYAQSEVSMSYIQIALCVGLLLESKVFDFMVTGCSSGQGMMLACNSFSGVTCGYVENVTDAYLFGRINNGNAISYPWGVNFGWAAEINLKETLRALFIKPMGMRYPIEDADRKRQDALDLQIIHNKCKKNIVEALPYLDKEIVRGAIFYDVVYNFIMQKGTNQELKQMLETLRVQYAL